MCRIQRHFPSGDRIWSAVTGWLQRTVMVPKSAECSERQGGQGGKVAISRRDAPVWPFNQTFFEFFSSSSERG